MNLTFQQVQKYKRSTNRISASTLAEAARALGVKPTALLLEEGEAEAYRSVALKNIATMNCVEELVETYSRIRSA